MLMQLLLFYRFSFICSSYYFIRFCWVKLYWIFNRGFIALAAPLSYIFHFLKMCVYINVHLHKIEHSVSQSCLTLYNPMDCSPQGSSVHRISQARILDQVAISYSRGYSWLRDQTCISFMAGKFFITVPPGKPINSEQSMKSLSI